MNKKLIIIGLSIVIIATFLVVNTVSAGYAMFRTGQQTVASKGTPLQLPSVKIADKELGVIKAMNDNTGKICIGYDAASALNSGTGFFSLYPGESVSLFLTNLNLIWIDGETGEGIEYITETY